MLSIYATSSDMKMVHVSLSALLLLEKLTILRKEKVENEIATMKYLRRTSSIHIPEVFGSGVSVVGPYMVISFLEGELLSQLLKDRSVEGRPVLNPRLSDRSLRRAYREMAAIILQLSKLEFDAIGALIENDGRFTVGRRPLTLNMNELMASGNLPEEAFPSRTFQSSTEYLESLALQQLAHLRLQQNDIIQDEEDCKRKFAARCLFLNIVSGIFADHCQGPFRLYCDDFRPSNILIDIRSQQISGVIDWEFTYVAPAEFTYTAPWWLLLQSPEDWELNLHQFLTRYSPRLGIFLDALRNCEDEMIKKKVLSESQCLSPRMERSMDTGLFWVCLAARYSSMFDEIYWTFIDQRYYGPFTSLEDRIQNLNQRQQCELDEFVKLKMLKSHKDGEENFTDHFPIDKLYDL